MPNSRHGENINDPKQLGVVLDLRGQFPVSSSNAFLVYGLLDPWTGELRYIGQTTMGMKRPHQHATPYYLRIEGNSWKANWIRKLLRDGEKPIVVILDESCTSAEMVAAREVALIAEYRAKGARLTNQSEGGIGPVGLKRSRESVERGAAKRRGAKRTLEQRLRMMEGQAARGKTAADIEHARAMGSAWKGKKRDPESVARSAAARRGVKRTPEQIARIKAGAAAGRAAAGPTSEETRAKMSAAHVGKPKPAGFAELQSQLRKGEWAKRTPEERQAIAAKAQETRRRNKAEAASGPDNPKEG